MLYFLVYIVFFDVESEFVKNLWLHIFGFQVLGKNRKKYLKKRRDNKKNPMIADYVPWIMCHIKAYNPRLASETQYYPLPVT